MPLPFWLVAFAVKVQEELKNPEMHCSYYKTTSPNQQLAQTTGMTLDTVIKSNHYCNASPKITACSFNRRLKPIPHGTLNFFKRLETQSEQEIE